MALDTTVQPFIQKMLRQPEVDPNFVGDVAGNFAGGFVAAKEQGRENDRKAALAAGQDYKEPPIGGAESFLKSYLRSSGVRAREASPSGPSQDSIYRMRAQEMADEQSLNNAVEPKNVIQQVLEVGNLAMKEIPAWLEKNTGMLASPRTRDIWNGVSNAFAASKDGQFQVANMKHLADLQESYPGLDVFNNPEHRVLAQKNISIANLEKSARADGLKPVGLTYDLLDPATGIADPIKVSEWRDTLPASERIRSAEGIASDRFQMQKDLAEGRDSKGFAPSAFERDISSYEARIGRKLTPEEVKPLFDTHMGTRARESAAGQFVTRAEVNALVKRREKLAGEADILERDLATLKNQKTPKTETIESSQAELSLIRKSIDGINSQLQSAQSDGSNQPPSSSIPSAPPPGKVRRFNERAGQLE